MTLNVTQILEGHFLAFPKNLSFSIQDVVWLSTNQVFFNELKIQNYFFLIERAPSLFRIFFTFFVLQRHSVNFINVFCAAFTHADPKSVKYTDNLTEMLRFWDLRAKKLHVERL